MKIVKKISVSRDLADWELKKISDFLEEEIGVDCEPVYEISDIEKEVINFSLKLVEMGHTVTWEQTRRNVEKIWEELDEKKIKTINRLEFFDCEPIYVPNEFEKELVRVSKKLIEMGEFVSEEESNRRVKEIWRKIEEKKQ